MSTENRKYRTELPRLMYEYFSRFADVGAPSFDKFARSVGLTLEDVQSFREHGEFERAYRECSEIRRDYLIDNALGKRLDASLVKYLLDREYGDEAVCDSELRVMLEVV